MEDISSKGEPVDPSEKLDELVRQKLRSDVYSLTEQFSAGEDHLKRLRTRIKKLVSIMEAIQINLGEWDIPKDQASEAKKEFNELLARVYLSHQDQQITEEKVKALENKLDMLTQQFPQYFGGSKDHTQN